MRIELLKQSFCNLTDLQETYKRVGLTVMKADTEKVIDSFKAVKSKIYNMDGGAGNLQTAVEQLDERINKVDSQRVEKVDLAMQNLGAFLHTVRMADQRAAQTISASNALFYEANPWAIPPPPPKKKSVWQRIKDAFKKAGKAIAGAFKKAVDWVVDCAKKAWTATKNFIVKHWKAIVKIVVGIVVIAGLAALSVFTGGAAAPLFLVAAKGAAIAAATGAAVTVVSGVVQGKSAGEIFDSCGDSILMGAVTGAVGGFAGAAAGAVTSATGSQLLGELTKIGVEMGGKIIATGTNYLIDNNGSLDGYWDAQPVHGRAEKRLQLVQGADADLDEYGDKRGEGYLRQPVVGRPEQAVQSRGLCEIARQQSGEQRGESGDGRDGRLRDERLQQHHGRRGQRRHRRHQGQRLRTGGQQYRGRSQRRHQ